MLLYRILILYYIVWYVRMYILQIRHLSLLLSIVSVYDVFVLVVVSLKSPTHFLRAPRIFQPNLD